MNEALTSLSEETLGLHVFNLESMFFGIIATTKKKCISVESTIKINKLLGRNSIINS